MMLVKFSRGRLCWLEWFGNAKMRFGEASHLVEEKEEEGEGVRTAKYF